MIPIIESENELRVASMNILIKHLGAVNAERFVSSIKNDHFDYTRWQRRLWDDRSVDEIHEKATDFYYRRHEDERGV